MQTNPTGHGPLSCGDGDLSHTNGGRSGEAREIQRFAQVAPSSEIPGYGTAMVFQRTLDHSTGSPPKSNFVGQVSLEKTPAEMTSFIFGNLHPRKTNMEPED